MGRAPLRGRAGRSCLVLIALLAASAGCVTGAGVGAESRPLRPAVDTPVRFEFPNRAPGSSEEPSTSPSTAACTSPAVDPRTGEELRFIRSRGEVADYEVPEGRYGVAAGEALRIECGSGRPVGIVRR